MKTEENTSKAAWWDYHSDGGVWGGLSMAAAVPIFYSLIQAMPDQRPELTEAYAASQIAHRHVQVEERDDRQIIVESEIPQEAIAEFISKEQAIRNNDATMGPFIVGAFSLIFLGAAAYSANNVRVKRKEAKADSPSVPQA